MVKAIIKGLVPREVRDLVSAVNHYRRAHGVYPRLLRPRTLNEKTSAARCLIAVRCLQLSPTSTPSGISWLIDWGPEYFRVCTA